jgi:hypothetical protein
MTREDIYKEKEEKKKGDFLVKLWGEIFEQLYSDEKSHIVW